MFLPTGGQHWPRWFYLMTSGCDVGWNNKGLLCSIFEYQTCLLGNWRERESWPLCAGNFCQGFICLLSARCQVLLVTVCPHKPKFANPDNWGNSIALIDKLICKVRSFKNAQHLIWTYPRWQKVSNMPDFTIWQIRVAFLLLHFFVLFFKWHLGLNSYLVQLF